MKKTDTTELDKIQKVNKDSQLIGDFIGWLHEQEIVLAEWSGSDCECCVKKYLWKKPLL